MSTTLFWVGGEPATFATAGETSWKARLRESTPPPALAGRETGMELRFSVSSLRRNGHPFDVDNLCDPVFVVVIRKTGWFGGRKTGLSWWSAAKRVGEPPGCQIAIHEERTISLPTQSPFWDENYSGPMPKKATSPELPRWALDLRVARAVDWIPESCVLYLGFADPNVNIGEIATGRVKSAVDCLYPWLGGTAKAPEDWRVETLVVERGLSAIPPGTLHVRLWETGRIPTPRT